MQQRHHEEPCSERVLPNATTVRFLLASIVSFLVITACAYRGVPAGAPEEGPEYANSSPDAGAARYDPPIEISFVREVDGGLDALNRYLPGDTLDNNRWTRLYEDVLSIRIRYDWTARGDTYDQKLGIALASGNIPDVVRVDAGQLRQLSNAGWIQELTGAYEKHAAPFTKEILNQEGPGPFQAATIDGKLMGIPDTGSSIENAQFLWIRIDWLERLRLSPPRTLDDVLAISRAFTHSDPDGDGISNTYGLAVTQSLWDPAMGVGGFMAAFGAFPTMWIEDETGQLVHGAAQTETREALRALQAMYRDGQIDSEFAFKKGDQVKEDVAAGKIGMLYGEQWSSFLVQANYERDPVADWRAFPIVAAADEQVQVPLPLATNRFYAVRKDYAYPEAIVKLFNLHLEKNWGESAEYDKYYSTPFPVWQLSPVTPFPARKNIEAFRQLEEARLTGNATVLEAEAQSIAKSIGAYVTRNDSRGWGWHRTYGPGGAFAILDDYEKNGQLLYEAFNDAPTKTMIERAPLLDDLVQDTFVNIILGRPLEEFERFVGEWNRLGGADMTAEVNRYARGITLPRS